MKKLAKGLAALVGLTIGVAAGGAAYVAGDWPVKRALAPVAIDAAPTPARLLRGKALVSMRCAGCHYDQKTRALSGIRMLDAPPAFGVLYSHNITQHKKGLGRYSDGELAYLLRTGIARDGRFTGPFMQSPHLSDEDLASIVAFLRSDDPWVAARDVDDRAVEPSFLFKMLMHVAWKPTPYPSAAIVAPPLEDRVAYGRYVAHALGDCYACHSADFKSLDLLEPQRSGGYFGGGNVMNDATSADVRTTNLTPDPETGIGKWTEDEFVTAVRTGIRKDGRALRYPMVAFRDLSPAEVSALYAYLRTVPPIVNVAARAGTALPPARASASEGEHLYVKYACASCHGTNGVGLCDLRAASKTYDTDEKLAAFIHDAGRFVPGTKMPTWDGVIPESDFAHLVAHVHLLERRSQP